MKLGYVLLGPPHDGIRLHSAALAAAARAAHHDVIESEVSGPRLRHFAEAGDRLAKVDVVHAQVAARATSALCGPPPRAAGAIAALATAARRPLVFTIHDLAGPPKKPSDLTTRLIGLAKGTIRSWERATLGAVGATAAALIVSSNEEHRRWDSRGIKTRGPVSVIPLPAPARTSIPSPPSGEPTITLLGFIHPRKGHGLAIEALPLLPDATRLVFAGGAAREWNWFARLQARRAQRLGVGGRLTLTGRLDEASLQRHIAATTLGICPFQEMAASGSLATWIGSGVPVLASAIPQIAELNQLVPGSIEVFDPYTPMALATRVLELMANPPPEGPRHRLAEELSAGRIFARHEAVYDRAVMSDG